MIFDSAILPLGVYLQEIMMGVFKDLAVRKFITAKNWKQLKCSAVGTWLSKSSVENVWASIQNYAMGIYLVTWMDKLCSLKASLHGSI